MSVRIIVRTDRVTDRSGTTKAGKPYHIREQAAAIDNGNDFPEPIRLTLEEKQPPYAPGVYTLTPDSFRAGEYGDIQVSRYPKLLAVEAKKAAA